jgi:hypothetical protein
MVLQLEVGDDELVDVIRDDIWMGHAAAASGGAPQSPLDCLPSCAAPPPPPHHHLARLAITDAYPSDSSSSLALKQPDISTPATAMELLRKELTQLEERGHFDKTVDQVQATIDLLTKAKQKIANGA